MFRVKICGITNVDDARMAVAAGADAVGLNFYPGSRRCIDYNIEAHWIARTLPPSIVKVGLFVNATPEHIAEVSRSVPLDLIQLHGDEPPELIASLPSHLPVMRAFRIGAEGLAPVKQYLDKSRQAGRAPDLVLLDAYQAGQYGGTGHALDWTRLEREKGLLADYRIVLAGGLNSSNVAEAILNFRPDAVDTASGVESAPGEKDPTLVQAFVSAAKAAFSYL